MIRACLTMWNVGQHKILSGYPLPRGYPHSPQPLLRQPVPTIKQIHVSHLYGVRKNLPIASRFSVSGFSEKIRPKPSSAVYYFPLRNTEKFRRNLPSAVYTHTGALRLVGISKICLRLFVPLFGLFAFLETAFVSCFSAGFLAGWLLLLGFCWLASRLAGFLFPAGFSASSASASRLASCFLLGWLASWLSYKKYIV